ncbi:MULTISPECIES: glycosyl hydrolase 53 family protein [Amycolatopsis]|uniref:Arabinogalactan endo-beta-1,4-galactanase n=1 Tax=Amycolatopsis bullii TaxID=941987 RepID=A0ABQ3KT74_9PSEU|nr:glycosyl hydrolase 53 family protein [Amycolatopsis bullii]GHG41624.1 hypothetical protein GCM10017567_73980 [Amycolatopsis bullii]
MTAYRTGRTAKSAVFLAAVILSVVLPAPAASAANTLTVLGADVSTAQRALDSGAKYSDANGIAGDPLDILKGAGVNYVRLRVWNNPRSGYNNKAKLLQLAVAAVWSSSSSSAVTVSSSSSSIACMPKASSRAPRTGCSGRSPSGPDAARS